MLVSILRSIGALVAGLVLAAVLVFALEVVTLALHPFPPGVDPNDFEVCKAHVAKFPEWVLALGTAAWATTALASSALATRLGAGRHPAHGYLIGVLLWAMVALNVSMLPYPAWFKVANILLIPLAAWFGVKFGRGAGPKPRPVVADASA